MVKGEQKYLDSKIISIPDEELNWCTTNVSEIIQKNYRLEASVFDIEGKHARELLRKNKWELEKLSGGNGFSSAFYPARFKRIWVENSKYPFYQPSQILEINPKPAGYLSEKTKTDFEELKVERGQILLTRSGTTANCTIVTDTLNNNIFSDDLIRINFKNNNLDVGYIYAFLKTSIGRNLIRTNNYGAVVSHIEPDHLNKVLVPNPSINIKKFISDKIMQSFELRDESNKIIEKAKNILIEALKLPSIKKIKPGYFKKNTELKNFIVNVRNLNLRLGASFHKPIAKEILYLISKSSEKIKNVGDSKISENIILPSRFKRIYVEKGQGVKFLGGRDIFELDPSTDKYLSLKHHKKRIKKELEIKTNDILMPSRGTLGNVAFAPRHYEGWTISDNIIKIEPANENMSGYLFIYLSTEYSFELIKRFSYGGVIDVMEPEHISELEIPLLKNKSKQNYINKLAIEANKKRFKAYKLEQEAIELVNNKVIHAF